MNLIKHQWERRLAAYREEPDDIEDHARIEKIVLAGGYGYRQIMELVQNGADAILEYAETSESREELARITVTLANGYLYVANTGAPLSEEGAKALLRSHSSPKRGNQIGRFGIGFKSLLRLGGRIDIISRSMSMRFDPDKARQVIREEFRLSDDDPVPGLRLAWELDGGRERQGDRILRMFDWATTIVRAQVKNESMFAHLKEKMEDFPAEFLLFLPVPVELLMDFGDGRVRRIERKIDGEQALLTDGDRESHWRLFEREITVPDADANSDATKLHSRDKVPVAWAMPLDAKREDAGRFWAFFPTETPTRMPGIINAPWKINSDRNSLIPGEWNRVLMREIAGMITESLDQLWVSEDPGRLLDAFPRKLERQDEFAATLVDEMWRCLSEAKVVPDGTGVLRYASELQRYPVDDVELVEAWIEIADEEKRKSMVHSSSLHRNRKGRLEELARRISKLSDCTEGHELPCLGIIPTSSWLEEIATIDVSKVRDVLVLVENYAKNLSQYKWKYERNGLRIVPTESGKLCKVEDSIIAPGSVEIPGKFRVHSQLVENQETLRILIDVLGVSKLEGKKWRELLGNDLERCINRGLHRFEPDACKRFWSLLRMAPNKIACSFCEENDKAIPIRRGDGKWRDKGAVMIVGEIVASDDKQNQGFLVDSDFHENDGDILTTIGVAEFPRGQYGPGEFDQVVGADKEILNPWLSEKSAEFRASLPNWRNPRKDSLRPKSLSLPYGWMFLSELRGSSQSKATLCILDLVEDDESFRNPILFGHKSRRSDRPIEVNHPLPWLLCEFGRLDILSVPVRIHPILCKIDQPILKQIPNWDETKRKLEILNESITVQCGQEEIEDFWRSVARAFVSEDNLREPWLRDLWDGMATDQIAPLSIPSEKGEIPLSEIYYTSSSDLAQHVRDLALGVVVELSIETGKLWEQNGARRVDDLFELKWDEEAVFDGLLVEALPELFEVLAEGIREKAQCRTVSNLKIEFKEHLRNIPCTMRNGILHLDLEQLQSFSRSDRLEKILLEIENTGWLGMPARDALSVIADSQVAERRSYVAEGMDLPEKLLRAVGGQTAVLRDEMGESASRALGDDPSDRQVAELALALLGPLVLQKVEEDLRKEGLKPPARWGTVDARLFVEELGFPDAFAASSGSKRSREIHVSGPIQLPPLHDFQKEVVDGLRSLIRSGDGRRRAVVSLPTGGGKTRAMVQASVELVLKPKSDSRSVLWVAQTDEICEQAVQAFRQVWSNVGAESTDLRIVRLWGGHRNPARSEDGLPVVVVASIQTLNSRVGQNELAWLSDPGLVVIDECHHAIAKSYTGLLRWLDAEAPRSGSVSGREPPVIGLSATPFRSLSDEESRRLAKRFDQTWFPPDQKGLYRKLLDRKILALVKPEKLESDVDIPDGLLNELLMELDESDEFRVEIILEKINKRLAESRERNDLLIKTISESGASSVLCFANSVQHAEELAARLCMKGIYATAISGETPRSARRYFLSKFQAGEIRVLCNYNVLSTGFDAPQTDMILISRQVRSPVRYMQMVGRGLRGPKNGGTECCRIVTVMDNLGRFRDKHPYHYCARFFASEEV